jgi:hypothetical protein
MDGFAEKVVSQLPLADAVLRMFQFVCEGEFLDGVFQRHRGRAYEDMIGFPLFVQLIADALLQHDGSGRQSFLRAEEQGQLTATVRAAYGKLSRIPLSLSVGFFAEATARLQELFPRAQIVQPVPGSLSEFTVLFHDGKTVKHLERRLKVLRRVQSPALGGRLVVTQCAATGMAVAVGASEDGESAEQPLVPEVLDVVQQTSNGARLHVGDRMYCDLIQPVRFTASGDRFLVRWNRRVKFHRDDEWESLCGTDRYGRSYTEDWGWIGGPKDPRRRYVRRIHLHRDEGEDVIVLTDLECPEKYPADDLLEVYLMRWGIERMFQQVTEVFHLNSLIGSSPRATVFQTVFCLLLYNIIQVVRAYLAASQNRAIEEVSGENVFYDVRRQLTAWTELLTTEQTADIFSTTWTAAQVARKLEQLLRRTWSKRWLKSPSNTHRSPPPKAKDYIKGGHTSVYRLIQQARGAG